MSLAGAASDQAVMPTPMLWNHAQLMDSPYLAWQEKIRKIREKRAKKEERERFEKMAETMHRKRVERLKRKEKRNKLINS